jgi:hypothetical protein
MIRWVGICGRAGAGKDHLLQEMRELDRRFTRVSFADQLREEIDSFLRPADGELFWRKPYPPEIRGLLQWWGTNLRREDDSEYWVKRAEQQAKEMQFTFPVFTDVRFPNEANMIRRNGGIIVRVMAPPEVREARLGTLPPEHASETSMDDYPVDMHVTSTEENDTYPSQVARVVTEAAFDEEAFLLGVSNALRNRS